MTQKHQIQRNVYRRTDDNSKSIDSFLTTIYSVTSTIKGFVRISKKFDTGKFILFQISDISDNSSLDTYWTVNITNQASSEQLHFFW